jgi:uncharacterized FlaG/YvyC family protein
MRLFAGSIRSTTRRAAVTAAAAISAFAGLGLAAQASAAVTGTGNASALAGAIANDPPAGASLNPTYPGPPDTPFPTGIGDTPLNGFPTAGGTFGVLTSGNAELADDPNLGGGSGIDLGEQQHGEAFDPTTLRIDVNAPQGANCLGFDFRFLSEEYPEFVNAGYNDAFVAQLDSFSLNLSGSTITAPGDFAAGAGDQISVDATGPSSMSEASAGGTTYDGATPRLRARTPISPGPHSVYLTIFDAGDMILDSAVFVDNLGFENLPAGQCKSLALDPYEGQTGVSFGGDPNNPLTLSSDFSSISLILACNLPPGNEIGCPVNIGVSFAPAGATSASRERTARATAPVTLAQGSVTIPAGQSQQVSLPTTPEGKAALTAAKKKPAKLRKKAKKLLKKAKALRKAAKRADDEQKAEKLAKKAKKLAKKAKRLKKKAKKLANKPLGTASVTIANTSNGASSVSSFQIPR